MERINIICKSNEDDNFTIPIKAIEVNLTNKNHYHHTFWDINKNRNLLQLPNFYSNEGLDILYLSLFVYYADRRIKRDLFPDAWTRKIKLFVPVLALDKWNRVTDLVERMLSFLSGDIWEIEFRKRELNDTEKRFQTKQTNSRKDKLVFDKFSMLSGGLDSFVGAIDLLESSKSTAFVGHYGGGKGVITYQNFVKVALINNYTLPENNFFNFYAAPLNGIEDSTRTRSFMFFSFAIILASTMRKEIDLIIPENGLISLNIPLTNSRLGSSSTRTTHPYYLSLLQNLLIELNIPIKLKNPYQFKTKGEMLIESKNLKFLKENIINTMSCSHPDIGRYSGEKKSKHCGTCLPCIIRRAAIKRANITDTSTYRDPNFRYGKVAKNNLNVYKLGVKKFKKNSISNFSKIQISGPLHNNLKNFKELYERGMNELIELLDNFNE